MAESSAVPANVNLNANLQAKAVSHALYDVPPGSARDSARAGRELKFTFRGDAWTYYGIYVTNVLLTVITFGIYSAWAKVRTKRYFYGTTTLDGHNFDFDATPLSILLSRVIVLVVVLLMAFGQEFYALVWSGIGIASLLTLLLFPLAVVRGRAFNARHTLYRSVRFRYVLAYWPSFRLFALYFVPALMLGAIFSTYFDRDPSVDIDPYVSTAALVIPGYLFLFAPAYYCMKHRIMINQLRFGKIACSYAAKMRSYYWHALVSIIWGTLVFVVLYLALLAVSSTLDPFQRGFIGFSIFLLAVMWPLSVVLIYRSRILPLFYSSIRLSDGSTLTSSASPPTLFFKYFMLNTFALVFSLGMLLPWVKVRNWRYVTYNLHLHLSPETSEVFATQADNITPLAEELSDVADFDLDFGVI